MKSGEVFTNSPWIKWPDARRGPWAVRLSRVIVDGRPEVVGMEVWHGAIPDSTPPSEWQSGLLPGPRRIKPGKPGFREVRLGEIIEQHAADEWRIAEAHMNNPTSLEEHFSGEGAAWMMQVAEVLAPKAKGAPSIRSKRPREHYEKVARVYSSAAVAGNKPTLAVQKEFDVTHALATKWVSDCRHKFKLLPPTTRGQAKGAAPTKRKRKATDGER